MKAPKSEKDLRVFRLIVVSLGPCMLAGLIGAIVLVARGKDTPENLVALGSAAVGGLAGLLAPLPLNP